MLRTLLYGVSCVAIALATAACSVSIPSDPNDTLERISGGTLRVGAAVESGLVERDTQDHSGDATGPLANLVTEFGARHDASIQWVWASEESLVRSLEEHDLDLAIGGFTTETPWSSRAGVSRGYPGIAGADGREVVFLVPMGENGLLFELESFLDERVAP